MLVSTTLKPDGVSANWIFCSISKGTLFEDGQLIQLLELIVDRKYAQS